MEIAKKKQVKYFLFSFLAKSNLLPFCRSKNITPPPLRALYQQNILHPQYSELKNR